MNVRSRVVGGVGLCWEQGCKRNVAHWRVSTAGEGPTAFGFCRSHVPPDALKMTGPMSWEDLQVWEVQQS
jgi:hypothetical protein